MGKEPQNFLPELPSQEGPQPGPSWGNPRWPLAIADGDLASAMDPTDMVAVVKQAAAKAGKPTDTASVEAACRDSIAAMLLIRLYRVRGHLAAKLDPLGLTHREEPEDLQLADNGLAATVRIIEPLGPHLLLTCDVDGHLFRVVIDSDLKVATGDRLTLAPIADRIRWFDPATTAAIAA